MEQKKLWCDNCGLFGDNRLFEALNYAIGVLDNLTDIGRVDMEIIKIKKMAGIK